MHAQSPPPLQRRFTELQRKTLLLKKILLFHVTELPAQPLSRNNTQSPKIGFLTPQSWEQAAKISESWCASNSPLAIGPNAFTGISFISAQGYQNSNKRLHFWLDRPWGTYTTLSPMRVSWLFTKNSIRSHPHSRSEVNMRPHCLQHGSSIAHFLAENAYIARPKG